MNIKNRVDNMIKNLGRITGSSIPSLILTDKDFEAFCLEMKLIDDNSAPGIVYNSPFGVIGILREKSKLNF